MWTSLSFGRITASITGDPQWELTISTSDFWEQGFWRISSWIRWHAGHEDNGTTFWTTHETKSFRSNATATDWIEESVSWTFLSTSQKIFTKQITAWRTSIRDVHASRAWAWQLEGIQGWSWQVVLAKQNWTHWHWGPAQSLPAKLWWNW